MVVTVANGMPTNSVGRLTILYHPTWKYCTVKWNVDTVKDHIMFEIRGVWSTEVQKCKLLPSKDAAI